MTAHINNGSWRGQAQVSVNVGGTWKALRTCAVNNGAWRTNYDIHMDGVPSLLQDLVGNGVSTSILIGWYDALDTNEHDGKVGYSHGPNGSTPGTTYWITPDNGGNDLPPATLYEIRFTLQSGDALFSSSTLNTWLTLASGFPYLQQASTVHAAATKTSVVVVDIRAKDGAPANIIATKTITLQTYLP